MSEQFSIGNLIEALKRLDGIHVEGLGLEVLSYRGYYDRPAIEHSSERYTGHELSATYLDVIGDTRGGYKGGDYEMKAGAPVYVASWGEIGSKIVGLTLHADGVVRPALEPDQW